MLAKGSRHCLGAAESTVNGRGPASAHRKRATGRGKLSSLPGQEWKALSLWRWKSFLKITSALPQLHCSLAVVAKQRFIPDRTLAG